MKHLRGTYLTLLTTFVVIGYLSVIASFVTAPAAIRCRNSPCALSSTADDETQVVVLSRKQQKRRKPKNRRPAYYWTNVANVRHELQQFWADVEVMIPDLAPPPIPNESLLNHFQRHDLRAAIKTHGGRQELSKALGGAPIMPGKWRDAVKTSPELRQLLANEKHGLTAELPPLSPQQKKHSKRYTPSKRLVVPTKTGNRTMRSAAIMWSRQQGRKPFGYWRNLQFVIEELYEYLDECQDTMSRPAVWMPRPSEMETRGRRDLKLAIARSGGAKKICKIAGLVPYREWHYFEGQLELFVELKRFLDLHDDGIYTTFPNVSNVKAKGHERLHRLVQQFGGKKFVANRLGMELADNSRGRKPDVFDSEFMFQDLNWGAFDLDFGIRLLCFIRSSEMRKRAPLQNPAICMPTRAKLLDAGPIGATLDHEVKQFGGYENVARRLGLAYK